MIPGMLHWTHGKNLSCLVNHLLPWICFLDPIAIFFFSCEMAIDVSDVCEASDWLVSPQGTWALLTKPLLASHAFPAFCGPEVLLSQQLTFSHNKLLNVPERDRQLWLNCVWWKSSENCMSWKIGIIREVSVTFIETLQNCFQKYVYGDTYIHPKPCFVWDEYWCLACNINEYFPFLSLSQMATCHTCNTTSRHKGMNRDFVTSLAKTHSTPGSAGKQKTPKSANRAAMSTPKTPGKNKTPVHTPR